METGIMRILDGSASRMKELISVVINLLNEYKSGSKSQEIYQNIEINTSKLENAIRKVSADMNNYFRYVNEPDPDEISEISSVQLEAEELLCEVKVLTKESKPTKEREVKISAGKLPKLNLPEFDGDILQWTQFWDQFSSNIDNRNIANVDKLLYLKASLKGQAKQVIEGLESTNANYPIAISTLNDRYGKPTKVIDAHYSALSKILSSEGSITDNRRVLNDIERHLRVLSSLGEDTSHSYLRFLITEKFPEDLIYEMKIKLKEDTVGEIRKELDKIISAREEASRSTHKEIKDNYTTKTLLVTDEDKGSNTKFKFSQNRQQQKRKREEYEPIHRQNNYKFTSGPERKLSKPSCVFCEGNHYNDICYKFKSLEERRSRLGKRCYSCLKEGHRIEHCRNRKTCYYCQGSHNRALCPQQIGGNGKNTFKRKVNFKKEENSKRKNSRSEMDTENPET